MHASTAFDLGVNYLEHGEIEMALLAFTQAIRLDPKMAQAYNGRGVVYAMKDELDKALADCCEAVKLDPWNPEFFRTRGYVYSRLGQEDKGREDVARADQFEAALEQASTQ